MNLFGTGAAGVLGSGSTPWLLISLGLGLVVLGMWCRKKIFPRHVGAGGGQRPHRILPGFPRRDDLRGKDRVAGRGVIPFRTHATLQPRLGDGEKERTSKEEESAMRTPEQTFRKVTYLLLTMTISAALAACGSGGGSTSSTSPGLSGPATVRVSIASAPSYPDGTTFATSTSSPTTAAPPEGSPIFEHLDVTVTKLALIPSTGEDKSVTDQLAPPVQIDLLNLSGDNVATLLNQFSGVAAGEYSKIRVYYDNVVGRLGNDNTLFHPTANSHFDVHFMGGNLVIPVTSNPGGGIQFYSVLINVVAKYHWAGNSPNVLLRPQVFATVVDEPLQYKVTGYADNVMKDNLAGTFDIHLLDGVRTVPAEFFNGGTWAYSDNVLENSPWVIDRIASVAVPAFENGAIVGAIGVFDTDGRLQTSHITFSFPHVREGKSDNVWLQPDNTAFIIRSTDNVTVFPTPNRTVAYFDNLSSLHNTLDYTYLDNNHLVRARGYFDSSDPFKLWSYWISIGGLYP